MSDLRVLVSLGPTMKSMLPGKLGRNELSESLSFLPRQNLLYECSKL